MTVKDAGQETPAIIEMNRELAYGEYKLFQRLPGNPRPRPEQYLSVSKDPGKRDVFLGYYTLVAGMIIVLVTRIRERRRAGQPAAVASSLALFALLAAAPSSAQRTRPCRPPKTSRHSDACRCSTTAA